ncbi:MAG: transposase, partial [Gemmataceae bacterium]
ELGGDSTKWPTVKHFTSWLGLCPNFKQTGGTVKSSRTRKGKNRAAHALRLAAWGLMRSTSGLGCYLRRQRSRLGAPKAITATAHKLARIVYSLVRLGGEYVKQSQSEYESLNRDRLERSLRKRAKELGYEVVKKPEAAAEVCDTPVSI